MPHDTWERHEIVRRLVGDSATVLDIGGVAGELEAFLSRSRVTTLNVGVEEADLHYDGIRVPFADNAFRAAVSLDVLEHIPPPRRALHVAELTRVASTGVVLCCPLGTPNHIAAEEELAQWHREIAGRPHRFLEEHLETGLPTQPELRELATSSRLELRFQGDFRRVGELFRLAVLAREERSPAAVARYVRARLRRRRPPDLEQESTAVTNRAFLISPDLVP